VGSVLPDPAATPPPQTVRLVNLPNALTVLRLLVVPVFAVLLMSGDGMDTERRWWATLFFALAIITDRYDGMIARRTNQVTEFGKLADPIADKALTGTALIALSALGLLPWWVTVTILVREIGVTLLRFWVIRHGVIAASRGGKIKTVLQALAIGLSVLGLLAWWVTLTILVREVGVTLLRFWVIRHGVIAASRGGKLKTVLQALAIGLYILPLSGLLASARWWVMAAAVVVTVLTGIDYVYRALLLRRTSARAMRAAAARRAAKGAASGDQDPTAGGARTDTAA